MYNMYNSISVYTIEWSLPQLHFVWYYSHSRFPFISFCMVLVLHTFSFNFLKNIFIHERIGFPGGSVLKKLPANAGDIRDSVSIFGPGRSPGEGNGKSLQYSCLENPMDRGAWWAIVQRVAKSQTRLKQLRMQHTCTWKSIL